MRQAVRRYRGGVTSHEYASRFRMRSTSSVGNAVLLVAAVLLGVVASACSATGATGPTSLRIIRWTGTRSLTPAMATLTCATAARGTGFLADVAGSSCRHIAAGALARAARKRAGCNQILSGPQHATISGTVNGASVHLAIDRSDSCQTEEWADLGFLLGDPTGEAAASVTREDTASTDVASTAQPVAGTAGSSQQSYEVRAGDSIGSVAAEFGVARSVLEKANQLRSGDSLDAGRQLIIPAASAVNVRVTPGHGPRGTTFTIRLSGAQPGEYVHVTIRGPASESTAAASTADDGGTAVVTYTPTVNGDLPGDFAVLATGGQGTVAAGAFIVDADG
jgi:LysM repeat protein